jgi:alkylation response protein AidB-like acyl-CoA dehydrogenase
MKFDLSEEQQMLREAAGRFVRESYGLEHRRALCAGAEGFSREQWRLYAELGWLGLNLPEDVGGLGCSMVETMVLAEQLGRGMVLEPFLSTAVLCSRLIDRAGNRMQRQELLPALVGGELLLALAHDEPGARGADAAPALQAEAAGGGYRLSGTKVLVLGAAAADRLIVSARLDGDTALFLLPRDSANLRVEPYPLTDGSRAGDVHLDGASLPATALLCRGSIAAEVLDEALDQARLVAMAQCLGAMEACVETSADYIKTRVQFRQPLAKFQSLQHLMADMFVDTQEARSALYRAVSLSGAAPVLRRNAISAAKVMIGPAARRVTGGGIQLHGGYGTTDEYLVSHHFRYAFTLEKLFGDAEDHARRYVLQ